VTETKSTYFSKRTTLDVYIWKRSKRNVIYNIHKNSLIRDCNSKIIRTILTLQTKTTYSLHKIQIQKHQRDGGAVFSTTHKAKIKSDAVLLPLW